MYARIFYNLIFFSLFFLKLFCFAKETFEYPYQCSQVQELQLPPSTLPLSFNKVFTCSDIPSNANLKQLVKHLIQNNPKLCALHSLADAAELKARRVRLPNNPKFKYYNKDNEHLGQELYKRERRYGLYQKVPFPGKLKLKMEAQYKNVEFLIAKESSVSLDLILDLKILYQELYLKHTILGIKKKNKEKISKLIEQYKKSDDIKHLELNIKYAKIIDGIFALEQGKKALEGKINALLNTPLSTPIAKPEQAFHSKMIFDKERLIETAIQHRPKIMGRHALIDKHKTQAKLARRNYFPDFDLEVLIQRKKDYDRYAWYVKIGFDIPIWIKQKQKRESDEQEAKALSHMLGLQNLKNKISATINALVLEIETLDNRMATYEKDILPATRKIFKMKNEKYKAGKIPPIKMIGEIILLEKEEIKYIELREKREVLLAKLEREVGTSLYC